MSDLTKGERSAVIAAIDNCEYSFNVDLEVAEENGTTKSVRRTVKLLRSARRKLAQSLTQEAN